MPACSVCLVTLSLSEAGPGRFGGQPSLTDIYHTMVVAAVDTTTRGPCLALASFVLCCFLIVVWRVLLTALLEPYHSAETAMWLVATWVHVCVIG